MASKKKALGIKDWRAQRGSNPRPSARQADALPLSYALRKQTLLNDKKNFAFTFLEKDCLNHNITKTLSFSKTLLKKR